MRAKRVGSSVVSAITHTPASGPLGPVTVPEMSSAAADCRTAAIAAMERLLAGNVITSTSLSVHRDPEFEIAQQRRRFPGHLQAFRLLHDTRSRALEDLQDL